MHLLTFNQTNNFIPALTSTRCSTKPLQKSVIRQNNWNSKEEKNNIQLYIIKFFKTYFRQLM